MTNIPWRETAALIRVARDKITGEVTREVVAEESLGLVVQHVRRVDVFSREALRVTLPDRRVPPFGFAGEELTALCDAYLRVPTPGQP
jgi:hypothetical protein